MLGAYPNRNISQEKLTKLLNLPVDPARTQPVAKTAPLRARRLNRTQVAELVSRYQAGETVYELGRAFGINRNTVSAILKREGVPIGWRRMSDQDIAQAIAYYQAGESAATVAARFNVNPSSIHHHLKQRGIPRRPHGTNRWKA